MNFCEKIIKESEQLKSDCAKYGFYYFNTYKNRNIVFNEIYELLFLFILIYSDRKVNNPTFSLWKIHLLFLR